MVEIPQFYALSIASTVNSYFCFTVYAAHVCEETTVAECLEEIVSAALMEPTCRFRGVVGEVGRRLDRLGILNRPRLVDEGLARLVPDDLLSVAGKLEVFGQYFVDGDEIRGGRLCMPDLCLFVPSRLRDRFNDILVLKRGMKLDAALGDGYEDHICASSFVICSSAKRIQESLPGFRPATNSLR
jgi:hypothetical protein